MIVFFDSNISISSWFRIITLLFSSSSLFSPFSYLKIFIVLLASKIIKILHLFVLLHFFIHFFGIFSLSSFPFLILIFLPHKISHLHLPLILSFLLCFSHFHKFSFSNIIFILSLHMISFFLLVCLSLFFLILFSSNFLFSSSYFILLPFFLLFFLILFLLFHSCLHFKLLLL